MKALSIKAPGIWTLLNGCPIDQRTWDTTYRGPLALHASKTKDRDKYNWLRARAEGLGIDRDRIPAYEKFRKGGIVAVCELVDCTRDFDSPWRHKHAYPWAFALKDVRPVEFVPWHGSQRLFDVAEFVIKPISPQAYEAQFWTGLNPIGREPGLGL